MNNLIIIKTQRLLFKNYTFMIINPLNNKAICIDPSWEANKYHAIIEQEHVNLEAIFLTHHHLDHSNLANDLASYYDCPVYMTDEEVQYYNFKCINLTPLPKHIEYTVSADIRVKIIRTPGHTFGGACYLIDDKLFTGDTLFIEGCGMCTGNGADPIQMYDSLQKLLREISDQTQIYPGHQFKNPIGNTFSFVKGNNIYLNFINQDDFVKFRMRAGQKSIFNFM